MLSGPVDLFVRELSMAVFVSSDVMVSCVVAVSLMRLWVFLLSLSEEWGVMLVNCLLKEVAISLGVDASFDLNFID